MERSIYNLSLLLVLGVCFTLAEQGVKVRNANAVLFNKTVCPSDCSCNNTLQSVYCYEGYHVHLASFLARLSKYTQNLTVINAWFPKIPSHLNKLVHLEYLSLPECHVERLNKTAFFNMSSLNKLNLHGNLLQTLDKHLFKDLVNLKVLDISYNVLDRLPKKLFEPLVSLQVLDLRNNRIQFVASGTFRGLKNLRFLDLSHNQLQFLESDALLSCDDLEYLILGSNSLRSINEIFFQNLTKLRQIELENNPWVCSCSMHWLAAELNNPSWSKIFKNPERILCQSPAKFRAQEVRSIPLSHLECEEPDIAFATENRTVSYQDGTVLRCNVSGYPPPSVYWVTPQGEFIAHESQREWIQRPTSSVVTFAGRPSYFEARATPLEDGSLILSNFRRYFAGEYLCVAVNPVGNVSSMVTISITCYIQENELRSYVVSFVSMGITLVVMVIIAVVKMIVLKARVKKCPSSYEEDEAVSSIETLSPAHSPKRWHSPGASPTKSHHFSYSDEEYDSDEGMEKDTFTKDLKDIKETLDEMHVRLRKGMQQTTEKMRTRMRTRAVQLRESSSHYMHTLRDSSTHTAHRVRAGVQLSLEQMKSGVQSIKEFCGTGDISQTISTVSVETDVDSQEQSTVVKNVTYV